MRKIAIVGYGNLAKGIERAAKHFCDLSVEYIFSRRRGLKSNSGIPVLPLGDLYEYTGKIDALIITHGSGSDLRKTALELVKHFCTVDSFDMHSSISEYLSDMKKAASLYSKTAVISSGWDPGLLSLMRLYLGAFMPYAEIGTLWGKGISQGHSEVLRKIPGVMQAVQITEPKAEYEELLLSGKPFSASCAHKRVCYLVAKEGREAEIEEKIRNTEGYFKGYETEVNFISEAEFSTLYSSLYHKGRVCASGPLGLDSAVADFCLSMDSNPDFTAHILLATARAAVRLYEAKSFGAYTIFDIPPRLFYSDSPINLI